MTQHQPKPPGQQALRLGRFSQPNQIYSITTITAHRDPIFADWRKGRVLVRQMRALNMEQAVETRAFVVMPDHLHWLFSLGEPHNLPAVMRMLKAHTARELGGGVWQAGFYDRAIRAEDDLKTIARYIVANPLRAGLVQRIGDYPLWDAAWL
ncbi:MAG: REP-associated tyrosine transposase [Halothiobacillus sp.]